MILAGRGFNSNEAFIALGAISDKLLQHMPAGDAAFSKILPLKAKLNALAAGEAGGKRGVYIYAQGDAIWSEVNAALELAARVPGVRALVAEEVSLMARASPRTGYLVAIFGGAVLATVAAGYFILKKR
jgi:hypothetical protein